MSSVNPSPPPGRPTNFGGPGGGGGNGNGNGNGNGGGGGEGEHENPFFPIYSDFP